MKKLFLSIVIIIICAFSLNAQTKYEVCNISTLNVRSEMGTSSKIVGTVKQGEILDVSSINNGWAKVNYKGQSRYVSAKYLKPVSARNNVQMSEVESNSQSNSNWSLRSYKMDCRFLVYVILILSTALFVFRKIREDDGALSGNLYLANWIVLLAVSVVELCYVSLMQRNTIWFCTPDDVGWIMTIIDFFIFGFVVYNQLMTFFETLDDVQCYYNSYYDRRVGYYAWIVGAVAAVISGIFFQAALPIVIIAFAIAQIVQIVLIFRAFGRYDIKGGILSVVIYILGSVATVIILLQFLALLIIVLIGLLVLKAIGSSSEKCCGNCRSYNGGYCYYRKEYVNSSSCCNKHEY